MSSQESRVSPEIRTDDIVVCPTDQFPMQLRQERNPKGWSGSHANGNAVPYLVVLVCPRCQMRKEMQEVKDKEPQLVTETCESCEGSGRVECPDCDGRGTTEHWRVPE